MAPRRLNVLVYSGTGTTAESVRHCLLALRRLLYPNYAVIAVGEAVLGDEPWQASCALLVVPGGADMGYARVLNGAVNRRIAQYVRAGGSFLGLCAGGYFGSAACEFEVGRPGFEVVGKRELGFFPGVCRGGAYPGFVYGSEAGARAVRLAVHADAFDPGAADLLPLTAHCYANGGGVFVDAQAADGIEVLASYPDDLAIDGGDGRAAVVLCRVGSGSAILSGVHPEFESANLADRPDLPHFRTLAQTLREHDQGRSRFLQACLVQLGLEAVRGDEALPRLTSMHLCTQHADDAQELLYKWQDLLVQDGSDTAIRGEHDTFCVLRPDIGAPVLAAGEVFGAGRLLTMVDQALRHEEQARRIEQLAETGSRDAAPAEASDSEADRCLQPLSVAERQQQWLADKARFDRLVDTIYRAVRNLGADKGAAVPAADEATKQEVWAALVRTWEARRSETGQPMPADILDAIAGDDSTTAKRVVVYEASWPQQVAAFDFDAFFAALQTYRDANPGGGSESVWGDAVLYAPVTTSTNTLLEENPSLVAALPTGFTFTATTQLAARGRGGNVWLAPPGQLILSTVVHHPLRFAHGGSRPVIFLQYLAAIAVVEAVHQYAPGFDALDVRLKWPNDIYAADPASPDPSRPAYVKIGGIRAHCSFRGSGGDGAYQVVVGIGLNATNARPTTSLEAMLPAALRHPDAPATTIVREALLASLLVRFEHLYALFCRTGFAGDLADRYYRYWLHTGQVVTLEAVAGAPRAKVLGITADWGLLHVAEVAADSGAERPTGRVWKLQSDENSFDFWKGLVRTKT